MRFYKESNRWYADIPTWVGSKEELEMVCGADTMLEILSDGSSEVNTILSLDSLTDSIELHLINYGKEEGGAYYRVLWNESTKYQSKLDIWLCDVTLFVFSKLPDTIYLIKTI